MKYLSSALAVIMLIATLTGCAAGNGEDRSEASADSGSDSGWTASQEVYNSENDGSWRNIQYCNGKMYYSTLIPSGEGVGGISVVCSLSEGEESKEELALEEGEYLNNFAVDEAGAIYVYGKVIASEEGEGGFLQKYDESGEKVYRVPSAGFGDIIRTEGLEEMASSKKGICAVTGAGTCLMWTPEGEEAGTAAVEWYEEGLSSAAGDFGLINGKYGIYLYHLDGSKVFVQSVDPQQGMLYAELEIKLPTTIGSVGQQTVVGLYSGYGGGIYVSRTDSLFLYDDETKEVKELLGWEDDGINVRRDQVVAVGEDSSGTLILATYDMGRTEAIIARVAKRTGEESDRKVVEIGYLYESDRWETKDYVTRFNASQSEIELRYHQYANPIELQLALVQGEGPDIISLNSLTVEELAAKDILEDLTTYFNGSEALKDKELLPSMQQAMTINGGIRFVFPCFGLRAMVLSEGDAAGSTITTADFLDLAPKESEGYLYGDIGPYVDINESNLLYILLQTDMGQYVDWQGGTCSFDDGRFAELLEKIKQSNLPENGTPDTDGLTPAEQMQQGLYHALFVQITNMHDYVEVKDAYEGIAVVTGYPNQTGEARYPVVSTTCQLGINSASRNKEEAWRFLEYVLLEYEGGGEDYLNLFSVFKDMFEEQLSPTPDPKMEYTFRNEYTGEVTKGFFEVTETDREEIRRMADCAIWNQGASLSIVGGIVSSEVNYFFQGDKSAEDVAGIIQNRVQLYLNENISS